MIYVNPWSYFCVPVTTRAAALSTRWSSLHSSAIFCHVARLTDGVPVNLAVRCQVVSSLDRVTTGDTDPVDLVTDG